MCLKFDRLSSANVFRFFVLFILLQNIFKKDGSKDPIIIIFQSTQKAAVYVSLLGLLSLPFAGLLSVFFKFIEIAQELIMILYLKNNLPLNLKGMLDFLKNYELTFLLPFMFQHKNENQANDDKFGQNQLSSLFLDNASTLILVSFVMPWLFLILFWSINKLFHLERFQKIAALIESIKDFFKFNLIFLLFQNSNQEISLFFALQLRYFSFSNEIQILSCLLCLFFLIGNFSMIFWWIKITKLIISNNCLSIPKEYQSIFQNIDVTKKFTLYYPIAKFIKKFFLSFFVVFLYSNVTALAICLIFLSMIMYTFIRIIEPFENKYRNMICEITEFLQCCLYGLLFLYYTCRLESTDDTALYIGYLTIILVIIIILLNFGMFILNLLCGSLKFICQFNKLREAIQLGDLISEKIASIKMKEFTYEKIWKDPKTGIWYKKAMFSHKLVTYREKGTQCDFNCNPNEKKPKTSEICEKSLDFEDVDNSQRKFKEGDLEMGVINEREFPGTRNLTDTKDFPNKKDFLKYHNNLEDNIEIGEKIRNTSEK